MTTAPYDLTREARFFLEPRSARHRQYEALRSYFVDGHPSQAVAAAFNYSEGSFRVLCHHFRRNLDQEFFAEPQRGAQEQPKKSKARRLIIEMRKRNLSVFDIAEELEAKGKKLSPTAIGEVLREEGFARLPRRTDEERPVRVRPDAGAVADVRMFHMEPRSFETRFGGLFVLIPLLVRLGVDALAGEARLPGSKMVPAVNALLAALALKLASIERKNHVMDMVFDEGLALFAGLNVIPKTTFLWQYSSRLGHPTSVRLLQAWLTSLRRHLDVEGDSFNLDFHAIPFFGHDEFVEKHYLSKRSRRDKAVLTFVAQDADANVLCYANADLRKGEENDEVLRFVEFWRKARGAVPRQLVFDSKLTTYANLWRLHEQGITFTTLRRRTAGLMRQIHAAPPTAWMKIELDVPHRKFKTPTVLDEKVKIRKGYPEPIRQISARNLGHEEPTILLTDDMRSTAKKILERYARRMVIENELSDQVHFFHLDALSSAVAMKVDFDVTLTVIASGLYRLLGKNLHGFAQAQARQIFRRFLDTNATVHIAPGSVRVCFPRRAHNPLLIASGLLDKPTSVPWWGGASLRVEFP